MTAGGMRHAEGPTVCPFVALESDRDRRLDEPDHRHRCYAVPTPEPRAIAHQEAYCLSPGFTLCPIFQDWARRAAANPIITGPPQGATSVGEPEQLGAFDGPAAAAAAGGALAAATAASASSEGLDEPGSRYARPQIPPPEPAPAPQSPPPTQIERIASSPEPTYPSEPAPLPGFLASRERATAPLPPEPVVDYPTPPPEVPVQRVKSTPRDERAAQRAALVPSWDREEKFNPPVAGRGRIGRGEGSDIVGRMTTILAVLALLSLALLLLVFAPGFLGSPDSSAPVAGASATPARTAAPATATPLPAATPQTYIIKAGDSLFGIATRFGLTLEQLQAANPQITNPNLIQIGDVIVIPPQNSGVPATTPRVTP